MIGSGVVDDTLLGLDMVRTKIGTIDIVIGSSETPFSWDNLKQAWIHAYSGMRYAPSDEIFCKFVTFGEGDNFVLYYDFDDSGEGLVLVTAGKWGFPNSDVLAMDNWDRKLFYLESTSAFTPALGTLFCAFMVAPSADVAVLTS